MKQADFLQKLLNGVEVEWKTLGDAFVRTKGTNITATRMKELHKEQAPIKIFAGGKTIAFVDYEDIPQKDINNNPSIIVKSRGVIEFEYYDKPFSHKNEMWAYYSEDQNIDTKFVYYFLKIHEFHFQNLAKRMQMPQIATPDTDKFFIPIPLLSVQKEIVRILDTFTELTAELTAELTLREKQYLYYRDKLLNFKDINVEGGGWRALTDIVNIKNGKDWKKLNSGNIPVYGSGGVMNHVDTYSYNKPTVLIPRKGSLNNIFYLDTPFWNVDTIFYTEIDEDKIRPKFLYYYIKTLDLTRLDTGSGRPSLTQAVLNKVLIFVPPLEEQARIVAILDRFDTLTHSITEGLPREIELRQKQYEYYRELLLNFPKPTANSLAS